MQIPLIQKDAAPDVVRRVYEGLENAGRPVGNIHKALANKPDILRGFLQLYGAVMAEGTIPARLKELLYLRATFLNGCANCARTHTANARAQGVSVDAIEVLKDPGGRRRADLFSDEERAALRYVDLLTSYPSNLDNVDLDTLGAHFSEEQAVEVVATIAMANWTNRINEGLRVPGPAPAK
jgi:uncharacterized peroxidase-related enzyme